MDADQQKEEEFNFSISKNLSNLLKQLKFSKYGDLKRKLAVTYKT